MFVTGGDTDVKAYFVLRLTATNVEATGLTIANFDLQYVRSGEVPSAKVDAVALAATDTAHTDNRGIEIDATDQPGLYRVDWPDAAFAAGVKEVILTVKCATVFTEHLRVTIDPPVNVTKFGGTAGAFQSGRPRVSTESFYDDDDSETLLTSYMVANLLTYFDNDAGTTTRTVGDPRVTIADEGITADTFVIDAIGSTALAATAVTKVVDAFVAKFCDDSGTAQAGGATTITLQAGAVATDNFFNGAVIKLVSGTGADQSRHITGYVGATKVATVASAWTTNPDNTTTYIILGRIV